MSNWLSCILHFLQVILKEREEKKKIRLLGGEMDYDLDIDTDQGQNDFDDNASTG